MSYDPNEVKRIKKLKMCNVRKWIPEIRIVAISGNWMSIPLSDLHPILKFGSMLKVNADPRNSQIFYEVTVLMIHVHMIISTNPTRMSWRHSSM